MHYRRKYEACKSKIDNLRDENVFFELKVKTTIFYFFQIRKHIFNSKRILHLCLNFCPYFVIIITVIKKEIRGHSSVT